jgi:transcriptional regulator with XRE-family HTH domain
VPDVSRIRAQLGKELRAVRTLAGLSQRALHSRLGETPSQVTLSRVENGTAVPDRDLVTRWLTACAATDEVRERVAAQLDAAHNETRAWADMLGDDTHLQGVARICDEDASLIRNCQMAWIPGLLQTAEYARLLAPLVDPLDRFDHAAMVADRMKRQQILYGTGRTFEFLIAEAALLWAPGEAVMPAQLDRLVSAATLSTVQLRILPARRVGAASWHSFVYREAAEDNRSAVTTELVHGGGSVTDPDLVALYTELWSQMWSAAAVGDDAVELIRRASG